MPTTPQDSVPAAAAPAEGEEAASPPPSETPPPEQPKSVMWVIVLMSALFASGLWDHFLNQGGNGCQMTYMYEYPMYIPVQLADSVQKRFPLYGLFVYGEGETGELVEKEKKYSGIPVLFIPGNSGSHKQVRSLASVALRKALDKDYGYRNHFDYFTVDFNEEFSALYGGNLRKQAEYLAVTIDHILGLYAGQDLAPNSVVLIGHSIGGLVAKSLFTHPKFDGDKVSVLLTLATPHEPVVVPDMHLREFYDHVDQVWNDTRKTELKKVTVVSVGGGKRDVQVRSSLTTSAYADVNVVTTDVPGIWASADHQCIVWCKQLVLAINRALFDSIDEEKHQITSDYKLRRDIFRYHLLDRTGGKHYLPPKEMHPKEMKFDKEGSWSDMLNRQHTFEEETVAKNTYVMVKVLKDPKHKYLTLDAINMDNDNWVFGCKATTVHKKTRLCEAGDNLSQLSQIIPSNGRRKTIRINMFEMEEKHGYTHIVVFVPKGSKHTKVHVDTYSEQQRFLSYAVPRWISFMTPHVVVAKTAQSAVFYNISLQGLEEPWQSYDIHVTPVGECNDQTHFGLMRFVTPWARDATQSLLFPNTTNTLPARLQTPRPTDHATKFYNNPEMHIYLNPSCRYEIEIQSSLPRMWGQIIAYYGPMLLPLTTAVILLTFAMQLRDFHKEGYCPAFMGIVTTKVSPMSVILPSKLLGSIVSSATLAAIFPITDYARVANQGIDFGVLFIIMFFVSIGIVTIVSGAAWLTVMVFGSAANKVVVRFFTRVTAHEVLADVAIAGISKFPFLISGGLIALAAASCGSIALCAGTFLYLVHLFDMYKDYMQSLIKDAVGFDEKKDLSSVNFQFSIALLWTFASVLNLPSLLAWLRGLPFATNLSPDPSLLPAIALSASLAVTWDERSPRKDLAHYDRLSYFLQFLCMMIALFGSVSMFRVNYFVSAAIVAVSVHQLVAGKKPPGEY